MRAMSDLVAQGKVLYWGTSEWSAPSIIGSARNRARAATRAADHGAAAIQYVSSRERGTEFAPLYREIGLGTTIWSPLASGLLTGKYNSGDPGGTRISLPNYEWLREQFETDEARRRLAKVKELAKVAADLGTTLPQLALAWCLKNPNVSSVLTGASKPEQVKENMKAGEVVDKLDVAVMTRIESILQGQVVVEGLAAASA